MYKIKIKSLNIRNIMDSLIENPFFTTKDNVLARCAGRELSPLRKDRKLIIANDRKTGETVLALRKSPLALPNKVTRVKGRRVEYQFDDFYFL